MGILLGLLTALTWGSSDFLARFVSRRIGALRTTLYMQLVGLALLTIFLRYMGGWGHLLDGSGWQPWAWGALAGALNTLATLSLYRSFETGKLAVVAPISASYPVLTVAISVLTGEPLTAVRASGVLLILGGVIVVVRGEAAAPEPNPNEFANCAARRSPRSPAAFPFKPSPYSVPPSKKTSSGIAAALVSAAGFGVLFWLLGNRVVPRVGFASTVWMIRLTSSALTALAILIMKQPISLPRKSSVSFWLLGMGLLDTAAFVLNNRGMQLEQVSVVSVLASLYGAVTVILSTVLLHERMSRCQWLGIAAIFAGITLISR
jgi:drug/metabolite transporter (DMT)-like permease